MSTDTFQFLLSPVPRDLESLPQSTFDLCLDDVRTVYEHDIGLSPPLAVPDNRFFSVSSASSPCKIRLIDCVALTKQNLLRVLEFAGFPTIAYSTISTPWQGMIQPPSDQYRLSVDGAEEADPIAIELLKQACKASLLRECCYLWLDRLCIVQTDVSDKNWHIQHMHRLYRSSKVCFVLPGGTHHLVRLDEETPWVHRSWTLQEALAPPEVMVLFGWELGPGYGIAEVVAGHSAMASLKILVRASVVGYMAFLPASADLSSATIHVAVSIFGPPLSKRPDELEPSWRIRHRPLAPSVVALEIALDARSQSPDQLAHAIWQSAVLRTCARPVDTIFSIMGLFGVTLDPATFSADDRRSAMIALAQAILRSGGNASWLGATLNIPLDRDLPTFPTFPIPSSSGFASVYVAGTVQAVSDLFGSPVRLDAGSSTPKSNDMNDAGSLHVIARATRIRAAQKADFVLGPTVKAMDGTQWVIGEESRPAGGENHAEGARVVYAVFLGRFERHYQRVDARGNVFSDDIAVMLLEERSPTLFYPLTFSLLSSFIEDYHKENGYQTWEEREFWVGGVDNSLPAPSISCSRPGTGLSSIPVQALNVKTRLFKISDCATPCRIRLIDCEALVEQHVIRIVEFPDVPNLPYSTISYPWLGVTVNPNDSKRVFAVERATHADPVGVDVLRHACIASLMAGCPYLWLDRLCIIQTDRSDKTWQIKSMYKVYQSCKLCIIIPGGIQRLVCLDEETSWIHRSWTLQEALAPSQTTVLFHWGLGWGFAQTDDGDSAMIMEVTPGESATAPLSLILQGCTVGYLKFRPSCTSQDSGRPHASVRVSIFSSPQAVTPAAALSESAPPKRKILAPNVVALSTAMDEALIVDPDVRAHAVWQSAFMRTSSRPVDMVFSIMGLFGVTLDPSAFHKDDRRGATIALAQGILRSGGCASWLGVAFHVEPDRTLSTFPTFPRTVVSGVALIESGEGVYEASELVGYPVYPNPRVLGSLPKGSMNDSGYLTFRTRAVLLNPAIDEPKKDSDRTAAPVVYDALDGSRWVPASSIPGCGAISDAGAQSSCATPAVYGALLGYFDKYFPGLCPAFNDDEIRMMILQEHTPGMFHVRSFTFFSVRERSKVLTWPEREFHVGGPQSSDSQHVNHSTSTHVEQGRVGNKAKRQLMSRGPGKALEKKALESYSKAIPQRVLEERRSAVMEQCHEEHFVWTPVNGATA